MKTLNQQELRSMEQFFQVSQSSLLRAMKSYLKNKYDKVIATDKYIVAIGDTPIALVAHLDTVFSKMPNDIYYDRVKNVMWSPTGLGADDRAGVYSIVQIIKKGYRPTIIFTTDEEKGCLGSIELVKDIPNAPTELKYIIQLDRRGSNDCVFYDCINEEFEEYVETFGFVTHCGSFSDISAICPDWGVAGVNLSIGYYNEHTESEILNIGEMLETTKRVMKMLDDVDNAAAYEYIEDFSSKWWGKTSTIIMPEWDASYGISKEEWDKWMSPQMKCKKCGQLEFEYNLMPVNNNGIIEYYCVDCFIEEDKVHWCSKCNHPYFSDEPASDEEICDVCKKKGGKA